MNRADLFIRVKRAAALYARTKGDPALAPTDSDDAALEQFMIDGAVELAKATGRIEASIDIALIAGESEYDVPGEVDTIRFGIIGQVQVTHYDASRVIAAIAAGNTGTPTHFGFWNGKLRVFPTPAEAATLTLFYVANSAYASSDLAEMLPPDLERALVDYVLSEWWLMAGETVQSAVHQNRYQADLARLKGNPRQPRIQSRRYVGL